MSLKFIAILFLSLTSFSLQAQISYENVPKSDLISQSDTLFDKYKIALSSKKLTHNDVLNVFFARQVTSYLSSSSNLSFSSAYATLNSENDRLTIGGVISNRKTKNQKLSTVFQVGLEANVKNGFSEIYKSGEAQNDIGINLKLTGISKGIIKMTTSGGGNQKQKLSLYRESLVKELNDERKKKLTPYESKLSKSLPNEEYETINSFYESIDSEYTIKYAEKAAEFITSTNNYTSSIMKWITLDLYLPITNSEYKFSNNINAPEFRTEDFYPARASIIPSLLYSRPKLGIIFTSVDFGVFQNDVVKTDQVKTIEFGDYVSQGGTDTLNIARFNNDTVYLGAYDSFLTYKIGAELTYFLPGKMNYTGLNLGFEKQWSKSDFSSTNYKIGIPFSLKDKEGKPKVNFVLLWREKFKKRSIGITIGLPIGEFKY